MSAACSPTDNAKYRAPSSTPTGIMAVSHDAELSGHAAGAGGGDAGRRDLHRRAARLTIGDFVAFLLLVGVFYRPLEKINAVIETYPKGIAGFRSYLGSAGDASRTSPMRRTRCRHRRCAARCGSRA